MLTSIALAATHLTLNVKQRVEGQNRKPSSQGRTLNDENMTHAPMFVTMNGTWDDPLDEAGTYTFLSICLVFLVSLQYTAAIRCLSCNATLQPHSCTGIETCPDGDECVTESYRNRNGETLFNVGCMSAQMCSLTAHHNRPANFLRADINGTNVPDVCTECCHSDLCNAAGCGTNGFPQQRGPVCLNCPESRDPADCDVISVCRQGEVCHVEEMYKFGDLIYKTSCLQKTDIRCASPSNPGEVGRRSMRRDNCFFCCPDDLCNTQCHASSTTPSTTHSPISHSNAVTSHAPSTAQTTQAPSTVHTTPAPIRHSFKGNEFFLMFLENYEYDYSEIKLSANVTFIAPNAQIQVTTRDNTTSQLVSGPAGHINIDANMTMRENGKTSKGIIVTSDTPMSVSGFNVNKFGTAEGYLALPVESLGVSYIVGTFRPNDEIPFVKYGTSFAVGAPYDNTVVNITLSTSSVSVPGHGEGNTITVVLDRLDTFYIATHTTDQDLTGTRIVSDKPVAVVSGNRCSHRRGCNYLVEYLPPVSTWGSRFMVPPIINSTIGFLRIVSSVNNTSVAVTAKTFNKTYTVSAFTDIDTNPSQPYVISSDKPVLVLLIFYEPYYGMTMVPSINQFSSEPVLVSPPTTSSMYSYPYDNNIVVSIRSSDQSGLQFRSGTGTDLPRVGSLTVSAADNEMYSFISATCNHNQTCSVRHSDDTVTFSAILYGFTIFETYAYPLNLML